MNYASSTETDLRLPIDALVRALAVSRGTPYSVFLGAGASVSSGIPSTETCIWEWKRSVVLSNSSRDDQEFKELALCSVRNRIQQWLDSKGVYPRLGDTSEYSFYIGRCYPIREHRRQYFAKKMLGVQPHLGYRLLCLLAEGGLISSVWTTNFDGLVAKAAGNFHITPIEIGIDCQQRLLRPVSHGELLCVSLHGDYRYDSLKNTDEEVRQQEDKLRNALIQTVQNKSMLVFGYSGRDASIMDALEKGYGQKGSGSLYWCGYGEDIPESVAKLLAIARKSGRTAHFVPTSGFDDVMARMALHCLDDPNRERARDLRAEAAYTLKSNTMPFAIDDLPFKTMIKSNIFEIELPAEIFAFSIRERANVGVWDWLDDLSKGKGFVAVPHRDKILALGNIDEIQTAFGSVLAGSIERTPVTATDTSIEHGAVNSLMRKALVHSFGLRAGVATDGRCFLWERVGKRHRRIGAMDCHVHRAAIVYLRTIQGKVRILLKPTLHIMDASGEAVDEDVARTAKNEILGYQHNKEANEQFDYWRKLLLQGKDSVDIDYPPGCPSSFRFKIRCAPVYACIGWRGGHLRIEPNRKNMVHVRQNGIEIHEPALLFSNRQGTGTSHDTHPTRGLALNRPFDFRWTVNGLCSSIRIGVVSPAAEAKKLSVYLGMWQDAHMPNDTDRDYLIRFPGYQQALGIPLEIPKPTDSVWGTCSEPDTRLSAEQGSRDLAQRLTRTIDAVVAVERPHVVLVFIPARWRLWRGYSTATERFDLHDFVKAYCVQRGIATQFLEEDTFDSQQPCRVWWWLSVAIYAKAMRTPWVLKSLDSDTAFVGLGYAVERAVPGQQNIILGCSHLYNAQGEGLQFRLTKVEDPIMRGRNPHMSYDDARRTAETIRQLFYESRMCLPKRVVVHKQTPFLDPEKEGLLAGLCGTDMVDLLEVNIDNPFRYFSSKVDSAGNFEVDGFPVRRGTVVKMDDYMALVWCHGVTDGIVPSRRYFQGKRYIPAPLLVRRFAGAGNLETIASEILGLAKMDWNSADIYSKLPVTIHSSKQIARIGAKLQRFGPVSYDYRLFM